MTRRYSFRGRGPKWPPGVSYVELLMVVMIMTVLTGAMLPTAKTVHRRLREKELRRALADVRRALDKFHEDWQKGCVESEDEYGWPTSLDMLVEGVERKTEGPCAELPPPTETGGVSRPPSAEPETKTYLRAIPKDPFNIHDDEWDVAGWRARSYEDDFDESSWGGDGIYDIRSSSTARALDGTYYEEW